jgi:glucose-6-phosphate isomerase
MLVDLESWKGLVSKDLIEDNKYKLKEIKKKILSNNHSYTFLRKDNNDKIFNLVLKAQNKFKSYEKIFLIGTGGSSLGAKAFLSIINSDRISFLESLDPSRVLNLLEKYKKKKLGVIIISKSGETLEVLCLLDIIIKSYSSSINVHRDALIISDKKESKLYKIANFYNISFMEHDPTIGGRYSCFSVTGLVPLQLAGADSIKIKKKADISFMENLTLDKYNNSEAINILAGITKAKIFTGHVFLVYMESFSALGQWYRQLWAESLGKHHLGLHLMTAVGPVDQHSQLQMWLDGPNNLVFTIVIPKKRKNDIRTSNVENILPDYLQDKNIGEILNVMGEATATELKKANRPVRVIYVDDDTINSAVHLMTMLLLEVALIGEISGINPFNQPAVERIKNTTKFILDNYDRN